MVQKRPFEDEEVLEFSSKLPRQDPYDKLSFFFSVISSFEDANQISDISVDGGFTNGKPSYDEKFLSREKDIKHCGDDDPGNCLPGNLSFSSGGTSSTSKEDVWIEAPFNTCFFPEYFYPECPVTTLNRREDIYFVLLECPPHKQVPIGPLY